MDLAAMLVSQRKLRAPEQMHMLVEGVRCFNPIPPAPLSEDDDGSVQVEDGHHRVTAYWLAGRPTLWPDEYILTARRGVRPRFGHICDLIARVRALGAALP